jgi:hypothetical protein
VRRQRLDAYGEASQGRAGVISQAEAEGLDALSNQYPNGSHHVDAGRQPPGTSAASMGLQRLLLRVRHLQRASERIV